MTNIEIEINVNAKKALKCIYDTAKEFSPEQLSVDKTLMTLYFTNKQNIAIAYFGKRTMEITCAYFFVITSESDSKCKISIHSNFCITTAMCDGYILQFLSEFLKSFSEKLS